MYTFKERVHIKKLKQLGENEWSCCQKITSSLTKSNFSLEENVGIAGEIQVLTYYVST